MSGASGDAYSGCGASSQEHAMTSNKMMPRTRGPGHGSLAIGSKPGSVKKLTIKNFKCKSYTF